MRVAVDVGGTKTLVVVTDNGKEVARHKHLTDADYEKFVPELISQIEELTKDGNVEMIAVGVPGMINYETEKVVAFGNLGWHDVDIKQRLERHFEVPVLVENDANFGALGEASNGAGKDYGLQLYLTISTGIGSGVTWQGKISNALKKSEAGHMHFRHEGKLVDWESFASGKAFYEKYSKMGKDVPVGDEIWDEWAENISLGIGSLIALIHPDVIVIGGSMGEWLEKYRSPLLNSLQVARSAFINVPPIVEAKDPHNAVINGCQVAMEQHASNS